MSKLLFCPNCQDVGMLFAYPVLRPCRCGACHGMFLQDNHHCVILGPGIALGIFNGDLAETMRTDNEAGYWPVRVWKIPDGDRIIVADKTGQILAPCTRCKPFCKMQVAFSELVAQGFLAAAKHITIGGEPPKIDKITEKPPKAQSQPPAGAVQHKPKAKSPIQRTRKT